MPGHETADRHKSLTYEKSQLRIYGFAQNHFTGATMYAVIKTGGKQYRVSAGQKIKVEQIPADVGSEITLGQVLMVGEGESVRIGTPVVDGSQPWL